MNEESTINKLFIENERAKDTAKSVLNIFNIDHEVKEDTSLLTFKNFIKENIEKQTNDIKNKFDNKNNKDNVKVLRQKEIKDEKHSESKSNSESNKEVKINNQIHQVNKNIKNESESVNTFKEGNVTFVDSLDKMRHNLKDNEYFMNDDSYGTGKVEIKRENNKILEEKKSNQNDKKTFNIEDVNKILDPSNVNLGGFYGVNNSGNNNSNNTKSNNNDIQYNLVNSIYPKPLNTIDTNPMTNLPNVDLKINNLLKFNKNSIENDKINNYNEPYPINNQNINRNNNIINNNLNGNNDILGSLKALSNLTSNMGNMNSQMNNFNNLMGGNPQPIQMNNDIQPYSNMNNYANNNLN